MVLMIVLKHHKGNQSIHLGQGAGDYWRRTYLPNRIGRVPPPGCDPSNNMSLLGLIAVLLT
jgi:hypothetical protein